MISAAQQRPPLTEEQKERIRRNREEALRRQKESAERRRIQFEQMQIQQQGTSCPAIAHEPKPTIVQPVVPKPMTMAVLRPSQPLAQSSNQAILAPFKTQTFLAPPKLAQANVAMQPKANCPLPRQFVARPSQSVSTAVTHPPPSPQIQHKQTINFSFSLVDSERFQADFTPFRREIVDKLKEVPSHIYNPNTKIWSFTLVNYEVLKKKLEELRQLGIQPKMDEIPLGVRKLFLNKISPVNAEPSTVNEGKELAAVDPRMLHVLFPFQRKGVEFGIRRGGRLLMADEMGLGKTVQAISIATAFRNEWPLLIICPSSVKYMWSKQIQRFLPGIQPRVVEKAKETLPASRSINVVIIMSYDMMGLRMGELMRMDFYVLIFDESHMLKEPGAKRTKVALELAKRAHRILMLSGTPALSRPAELFTQIRMIDWKIFPAKRQYEVRYCAGRMGRYGFEAKGQSNAEELKAVMDKIMIRRLKKDVLDDLPEKRREIIYLSGDAIDTKMKQLVKAKQEELERTGRFSMDSRAKKQTFMEYFVLTGQAKRKPVADHIVETYFYDGAPEKKVLVFAHHHDMLDFIGIQLAKQGVNFIRIDGTTTPKDRAMFCDQFQSNDKIKAALLSITAAGTGITLTAASVVIFAELYWNPSLMIQAEDRAHRVGQRDSVQVQYMLAKKTADMYLWEMVSSKLKVLGCVNLANENYREADTSDKLCTDSHLITDFFSLLNEEAEEQKQQHGNGTLFSKNGNNKRSSSSEDGGKQGPSPLKRQKS